MCVVCIAEEVMLAEEDKDAEEKSLDGAWYKRKHTNSGEGCYIQNLLWRRKNNIL